MAANHRRSERFLGDSPSHAPCINCGGSLAHRKDGAQYCNNVCKRAAFDERAKGGRVASVRRLKGGRMSVVVHMSADVGIEPGQSVRVG